MVSAAAATLLTMHLGFSTTVAIAVGLYLMAALVLRPEAGMGAVARRGRTG